jgi:hypothetical protein
MCVIIYKPKGIEMPSQQDLIKCFNTNPDGAGYMLPYNNKVIIRKGFMTFDAFKKDINEIVKKYNINPTKTPIVLHFRITTQGGVKKELCHPYPICRDYDEMRALASECDIALAHNGIISLTSESAYYGGYWDNNTKKWVQGAKRELNYNDTMTFIKDYASLIIDNDLYFARNDNKCELLERLIGSSKLAIMTNRGFVKLIGQFNERDGVFYSNLNAFNSNFRKVKSVIDLDNDFEEYKFYGHY